MASITPIPGVCLYSATKIFTDYLAWGMSYELSKYSVDVSAWRAMGVATSLTEGIDDSSIMVSTPENYVKRAMSKVTSGVHAGYLPHEIIGLIWTNLNDIMPYTFC